MECPNSLQVNEAVDAILESRDTTCLIVAHRLSTIARAERIVVLEGKLFCGFLHSPGSYLGTDGRITESGTYRRLVRMDTPYNIFL